MSHNIAPTPQVTASAPIAAYGRTENETSFKLATKRLVALRDAVQVPSHEHRHMVNAVINTGVLQPLITEIKAHEPQLNLTQGRRNIEIVTQELRDAGIDCPADLADDLVIMQQLMVPTADDALALAMCRMHIFMTIIDDVCSHSREETLRVLSGLGADATLTGSSVSPYVSYCNGMLREMGKFCTPAFLGVYRAFVYDALVGVLLEAELTPNTADTIDTQYVRGKAGYSSLWFSTLQFVHPCMDFCQNTSFWASALGAMGDYLNDINDVLSFYKEALHGGDFVRSRMYRRAVQRAIPYQDVYLETLHNGQRAQQRIHDLADDTQKRFVANYMTGYYYWHLYTKRYRWNDLLPELEPLTI